MDLLDKLQIKPGFKVRVIKKPRGLILPTQARSLGLALLIFAENKNNLIATLKDKKLLLADYFWVAYPKGSSKKYTDLNRDILSAELKKYGLESIRLIAINDTWSAMRFKKVSS
jgi:hypothetical protein